MIKRTLHLLGCTLLLYSSCAYAISEEQSNVDDFTQFAAQYHNAPSLQNTFQEFPTCLKDAEEFLQPNIQTDKKIALITQEEFRLLLKEADKDEEYKKITTQEDELEYKSINAPKDALFLVYIAADNNLHYFAWKNIQQMEAVGSNDNANIVIQLNTPGYYTPTKRYVIKKGKRVLVPAEGYQANQKLNSGHPQTLIDFVLWAYKHYPAEHIYLVLWNHGTGALDPVFARSLNTCNLFYANQENNMLEIDRSITYMDQINKEAYIELMQQVIDHNLKSDRGICFDETFKSYITNDDLDYALDTITQALGKKLDMLGFDACLMASLEVTNVCKKYVKYMVGSEEVEFAVGWNYEDVLSIFNNPTPPTPREFVTQIVRSYDQYYKFVTPDYTLSALDLEQTDAVEQAVDMLSKLLIQGLNLQSNGSVSKIIQDSKAIKNCTCFEEPTYKDLGDFLMNLYNRIDRATLLASFQEDAFKNAVKTTIQDALLALQKAVVVNAVGSNLKKAQGLSIYFPDTGIAKSYPKSPFALTNNWLALIIKYMYTKN